MLRSTLVLWGWVSCSLTCCYCLANDSIQYWTNEELEQRLTQLTENYPSLARFASPGQLKSETHLSILELGAGRAENRHTRPAMLAVAGLEGTDMAGSSVLLAWAEQLIQGCSTNKATKKLLETVTIYVIPRVNTEAARAFFRSPQFSTAHNFKPNDADHDGLQDEDGPEDLDGDGLISYMRVQDPDGEYMLDPIEPRLMIKADRSKGEVGGWRLLTEGIDNDKDELWNEDPQGGVNFNRNFPCNYAFFAPGSGQSPVSEAETRALANFMLSHPHISIVFAYGDTDNLAQIPGAEARPSTAQPSSDVSGGSTARRSTAASSTINPSDLPYYREIGKLFRDSVGIKTEVKSGSQPGTFADWMYFYRGRFTVTTHPWTPSLQLELSKSSSKTNVETGKTNKTGITSVVSELTRQLTAPSNKTTPIEDKRNEEDRAFLRWIDQYAPDTFVSWKPFSHPDFSGKKVEIGSFSPYSKICPPESQLSSLALKQIKFLNLLAAKTPRLQFRKCEIIPLGQSVYEILIQVENAGYLPTCLAQGSLTATVNPTRLELQIENAQYLSGSPKTQIGVIEGSMGKKEARWVVHAPTASSVTIRVISALGGTITRTMKFAIDDRDSSQDIDL